MRAGEGKDVLFLTQKSILSRLHKARLMGKHDVHLSKLAKVSLLIIDDYGLFPMIAPLNEDFHELVAARYEQRSTVMTSNLDFSEWDQAFAKNKSLATATLDRLLHNAYRMVLEGNSYPRPRDTKKQRLRKDKKHAIIAALDRGKIT